MSGCILIDTCEIEGNVDHPSWVCPQRLRVGVQWADRQIRGDYWIICYSRLGFVKVVQAIAFSNVSNTHLDPSDESAFAICAAMFQNRYVYDTDWLQWLMNSNSLPIALIQSLVVEVPGLKWGHDDTKDQMLGRALTYLVLYSTLGMMVRPLL